MVFTSYIAPRMDRFSLINVPCTYQPAPCEDFPADEQEECKINKADWLLLCSETEGFWSKYVSKHVCSKENYLAGNLIQPDGGKMRWIPPEEALAEGAIPATVGGCDCDYSIATNGSSLANLTAGVPASFIKVGMSIFYVQVSSLRSHAPTLCCRGRAPRLGRCSGVAGAGKAPGVAL